MTLPRRNLSALPPTMKALLIRAAGGIENLRLEDFPFPQARPSDVVVRVRAAGLNPVDVKQVLPGPL